MAASARSSDRRRDRGRLSRGSALGLAGLRRPHLGEADVARRVGEVGVEQVASSSTPSTRRGPGREKVEAASTAKTRPRPGPRSAPSARAPGRRSLRRTSRRASRRRRRGRGPASAPQPTSGDFSPGGPATSSPPAIEIISGTQWPPTKGGSSHSSAMTRGRGAPPTARAHRRQPALELAPQLVRGRLDAGRLAEPDHVLEHLAEGARVLLQDRGAGPAAGPRPRPRPRRRPRRRRRPPG